MNWSQDRRGDFIAWHLNTYGTLRRSDIMKTFRISVMQASVDIAAFIAAEPGVMKYDRNDKQYVQKNQSRRQIQTNAKGCLIFVIGPDQA